MSIRNEQECNEVLDEQKGDDNLCPDLDEDCKCVKDHVSCFLGLWGIGTSKGICPFIQPHN